MSARKSNRARGVVLLHTDEGWVLHQVEIPLSQLSRYSIAKHGPEMRGMLVERAANVLAAIPKVIDPPPMPPEAA